MATWRIIDTTWPEVAPWVENWQARRTAAEATPAYSTGSFAGIAYYFTTVTVQHYDSLQTPIGRTPPTGVLKKTNQTWQQRTCGLSEHCLSSLTADATNRNGSFSPTDPRISELATTLMDTNQVSQETYFYDQYNNKTDICEYDYGSGDPGQFLRQTHNSYLTNGYDTFSGTHLPSLMTESTNGSPSKW